MTARRTAATAAPFRESNQREHLAFAAAMHADRLAELLARLLEQLKAAGRTIPGDGPYKDRVEDARAHAAVLLAAEHMRWEELQAVLCPNAPCGIAAGHGGARPMQRGAVR